MKIQTFSILAGSTACNARCPFCISKMTPKHGMDLEEPEVNWRNFKIGARLAKQSNVTTVMITGKGEPTLFPSQITKYLDALTEFKFPFIEMQTNGLTLYEKEEQYKPYLQEWYNKGMTTIAISIVHYEAEKNREVYVPYKKEYIGLPHLIGTLHDVGYSVRLSCIMADGYIDSQDSLERLISFAHDNKAEQLTVTPMNFPHESNNTIVEQWTREHYLKEDQLNGIKDYITNNGHQIMKLMHGATVYDINGQNVCLSSCLSIEPDSEDIRQLIFFPDGHLRYDWQYEGAILI